MYTELCKAAGAQVWTGGSNKYLLLEGSAQICSDKHWTDPWSPGDLYGMQICSLSEAETGLCFFTDLCYCKKVRVHTFNICTDLHIHKSEADL